MEEEIKAEFNKSGFGLDNEDEILGKCLTFCINYSLKPSDLVSSWEVYYLNRQLEEPVVRSTEMDGFLLHLQNEQKEAIITEEPNLHVYSSKDVDTILNDEEAGLRGEEIPCTPTDKSLDLHWESSDSVRKPHGSGYSSGKLSKLVTPFGRRAEKLEVQFSINNLPDLEHDDNDNVQVDIEDDIIKRVQQRDKCLLTVHGSGPKPGCRFMYDRIEDRFNAINNRIKKLSEELAVSGLYEEPTDPTVASQRNVFAVGMISCDGEGRLNEKSIMLQGSAELSGGRSVRLDLNKLIHFSIFPGQIVGIEGHNPSGHCLVASNLVASVPLSVSADVNLPPAKKQAMDQEFQSDFSYAQDKKLAAIIASGPFTTTDNLLFEPFKELLAYCNRKLPQLLILVGPFIDSEHPEINKGTTERSFDEIFHIEILRRLQDYVEYTGSSARVLLVPSLRDAHHDFVFPQPAFDIDPPNFNHQIFSLANPGSFEANQVNVGCCSVDILKELSREEISRNPADGGTHSDRMSRLINHILNQRSFHPLYPPAEHIPLDFSLVPEALRITSTPDILILPSDMKYFIKVLSMGEGEQQRKCVCVNPGRLARGEGGGTFAELEYGGSPEKMKASIIGI